MVQQSQETYKILMYFLRNPSFDNIIANGNKKFQRKKKNDNFIVQHFCFFFLY